MHHFTKNTKSNRIAHALIQRIEAGDYALRGFPSERILAESLSVSYLTARKAVQVLVDQDIMVRDCQGRAMIHPDHQKRTPKVAFLAPAFRSEDIDLYRQSVITSGQQAGVTIRPIEYAHWNDPVILDALAGFDGVFLYCSADAIPQSLLEQLTQANCKIVVFDRDLSAHGILAVQLHAQENYLRLFDALATRGYSEIHYVNVQARNEEILRREKIWSDWRTQHHVTGKAFESPTPAWEDSIPRGYELFADILSEQIQPDHAYVCSTYAAIQGALRVAYEKQLTPGIDFGLACFQCPVAPRFLCPSMTCLESPSVNDVCKRIFDWFAMDGDQSWQGSMLIHPQENTLFEGESTALSKQLITTKSLA